MKLLQANQNQLDSQVNLHLLMVQKIRASIFPMLYNMPRKQRYVEYDYVDYDYSI